MNATARVFRSPVLLGRITTALMLTGALSAVMAASGQVPVDRTLVYIIQAAAIFTLMLWTYRVYLNLGAFIGFTELRFGPGWAAVAYIVPIANLFVPYRALAELTSADTPTGALHRLTLMLWWPVYLTALATVDDASPALVWTGAVALCLAAAVGWHLISTVNRRQARFQ